METSDCAAALEPSIFHNSGASELRRYMDGAAIRDEKALIVATIGDATDDLDHGPFGTRGASTPLSQSQGFIRGTRLPVGASPSLAKQLSATDRDLGLRLLNRSSDAPWWSLSLGALALYPGDGGPATRREADGELQPILVDTLGHPIVAAWVPTQGDQRWYVIPDGTDWNAILGWLIHQALPTHVPHALRRARSPHFIDPELQTEAEMTARRALGDLEANYAEEKARLKSDLREASAAADPIRYGLLYGTGSELVEAISSVLTQAGFASVNLDELFGTKSADLLVTYEEQRRLVEVKSASGRAPENLVGDLKRHLETWPQLRLREPVDGGVLIVNHQHKLEPHERASAVYGRSEFVDALTVPVLGTRQLFEWWRASDWTSIQRAVLGRTNDPAEHKRATPFANSTPRAGDHNAAPVAATGSAPR